MDPRQLLKRQHRDVRALFKEIETADGQQARSLLEQLTKSLELHMRLEEEMFYPAIQQLSSKKAADVALEAFEEHGVVKLVLEQLPSADPDDERFHAKMTVLMELIEHHVEEEENEMFKLAEKLGDELDEIGERMQQEVDSAGPPPPRKKRRAAVKSALAVAAVTALLAGSAFGQGSTGGASTPGASGSTGTGSAGSTGVSPTPGSTDSRSSGATDTSKHTKLRAKRHGGGASNASVREAQQALKDKGHDPGAIDGKLGSKTQAALRSFQQAEGLTASGRLDSQTRDKLGVGSASRGGSDSATSASGRSGATGSSSTGTSGTTGSSPSGGSGSMPSATPGGSTGSSPGGSGTPPGGSTGSGTTR
jgi:peptidoglycan hydrolase-like protein with peptidoglycan-binding domain/hemerythrin-like domain-containing protein